MFVITCIITSMARNSLLCADVPLRNYSLHSTLLPVYIHTYIHGVTINYNQTCLAIYFTIYTHTHTHTVLYNVMIDNIVIKTPVI